MYKIIFTDIDGTLRNSKRELTKRTISAVKKVTKKGILVVLCSGRSQKYTANVSKECGASQYVITSNGANIYDYEKDKDLYTNVGQKSMYRIIQYCNKSRSKTCNECWTSKSSKQIKKNGWFRDRIKNRYRNFCERK